MTTPPPAARKAAAYWLGSRLCMHEGRKCQRGNGAKSTPNVASNGDKIGCGHCCIAERETETKPMQSPVYIPVYICTHQQYDASLPHLT